MRILIKNGRIIDPANDIDFVGDLLAIDGVVAEISEAVICDADEVVDASGCVVAPGFVDLHVHLRDPGFLHKETILTGQKAAARGGFTTICAMPNTSPVTDSPEIVKYIIEESKKADNDPPAKACPASLSHPLRKGDCATKLAERNNWWRNSDDYRKIWNI